MNSATWLDIAIVILFGLSILLGLLRGVIREVTALLVWLAAYAAAKQFYEPVGEMFSSSLNDPTLRHVAGFAAVFVGTVAVVSLVRLFFTHLADLMGLGLIDRIAGGVFGVVRAMIMVIAGTLVIGLTNQTREAWWTNALLTPLLERSVVSTYEWLPEDIYKRLNYRGKPASEREETKKDPNRFM